MQLYFLVTGGSLVWVAASLGMTLLVTRKLRWRLLGVLLRLSIFTLIFIAPLADELIAGAQFRKLCEEASSVSVDRDKAFGKTVSLLPVESKPVSGTPVPMTIHSWRYVDVSTKEVVLEFITATAKGGWLVRRFGLSERITPLTFPSYCEPRDRSTIFGELKIKKVQRQARVGREE